MEIWKSRIHNKDKYNFKTEPWTCFAIDPHRTLSSLLRYCRNLLRLVSFRVHCCCFWCDAQLFRIYRLTQLRLCCRRPIKNRPDVDEASPHCRQMPSTAAGFQISLHAHAHRRSHVEEREREIKTATESRECAAGYSVPKATLWGGNYTVPELHK